MPRMMDALDRLLPWRTRQDMPIEAKASKAHRLIAIEQLGQPQWAPRDYAAFAREGFMQNAIVYRSVRMVAEAAASIPLLLYEGPHEIESHPFLDLIAHPSLDHTSADFFESWYGFLLVAGNAYVEAVGVEGQLRELHALRPDRMKVIPGADGWPEGYEYTAGEHSVRLHGEVVEGVRNVLHVRLFHPANDYYGMSPIEAAASAIDIHNQAAKWNKALLDNSARPSGALVYAARDGQLTEEQFQRLKEELELGFAGARQAGRPMLLEGGLDWKQLSLSPKDMDFVEAKNAAAREIALALGVPPMLLGIPGDNTYSNYQEASRSFWRQTVLPLVNRTAKAMSMWLGPAWGGALELRPDLDQIEALAGERDQLWTRLEKASFLTDDEKRAAAGYGLVAEAEAKRADIAGSAHPRRFMKFYPGQPRVPAGTSDGGQWTSGGGGVGDVGSESRDDGEVVPIYFNPVAKTIEALAALFVYLSGQNSSDATAVIEFRAQDFLPGTEPDKPATKVGQLSKDEVDEACPRHAEVQRLTNESAEKISREGNYIGASDYGTKVHGELKRRIQYLDDANFRAEVSVIKSGDASYGRFGSIRVDVFENVGDGTVCVYDIKTGRSALTGARMKEIANNVHSYYPGTSRILVIETRPR